ncbi:MAG: DUF4336 domain-containing protein [Armatimonadota bacterium]
MPSLRNLATDLWIADAPASKAGFEFGARMTVVRLPAGGLFLHSPVTLTPELRAELDALGPVEYLISPSGMHYEDLPEHARAYPRARVYAVPGSLPKLKALAPELLRDEPEPGWAEVLDQHVFRGSRLYDEVVFYHRPTRTLILTDLCFNIPADRSWSTRLWARALGVLGKVSRSRSFDLSVRDRAAAQASLRRIESWDFDRLLLTHGDWLPTGGKEAFRRAFADYL